jgi:tetratricopeptide (TPR) repeat protein
MPMGRKSPSFPSPVPRISCLFFAWNFRRFRRTIDNMHRRLSLILLALIFSSTAIAGEIDNLIQSLGDPSPMKRSESEMELAHLGAAARPALIDASSWDDPAISSAATRVLLSLPWDKPDDPAEVKALLVNYGSEDEMGRMRIAAAIFEKGPAIGTPPLLRLLMEDPSEDVCWEIDTLLRYRRDEISLAQIRQLDPSDARAAALALCGWAWIPKDHPKALALLQRAIESESKHPSFDSSELDFAFQVLTQNALAAHDYNRAAHFRRLQADRVAMSDKSDLSAIYRLFTLHANYGPLDGFAGDLRSFSAYLGHPTVLYELARIYSRHGQTIESLACFLAARSASLTCDSRMIAAAYLADGGSLELARREANLTLSSNDPDTAVYRLQAHMALAQWAALDENDAQAVQHLAAATELIHQIPADGMHINQSGQMIQLNDVASELAWRSAKISLRNRDDAATKKNLDRLMQLSPTDADMVQSAFAVLKSAGRDGDAQKLFDAAYTQAHQELLQNPDDPILMNQVAWLCARCDQKLPEALDLSSKAAAAEPDSAAILDTFAEVNFRIGHVDEAVKLETQALGFEPDDAFMNKQLQRFRKSLP